MDETAMGRLSVATACDVILAYEHPEQRTRIVQGALGDLTMADAIKAQGQIISMLCDALDSLGSASPALRVQIDHFVTGTKLELDMLEGIPEDARDLDPPES